MHHYGNDYYYLLMQEKLVVLWHRVVGDGVSAKGASRSYHVRAVAGGFVRGGLGLVGQGRGGTGGVNTFLFLSAVAEPDADHLLLHAELFRDEQDLL